MRDKKKLAMRWYLPKCRRATDKYLLFHEKISSYLRNISFCTENILFPQKYFVHTKPEHKKPFLENVAKDRLALDSAFLFNI